MKGYVIFTLFMILLISGCISDADRNLVCIENRCFTIEIASTPDERAAGLMEREHLDPDRGMLFVFEQEGKYSFWMKNTRIPLDMIWIGSDLQVVDIRRNAQPCPDQGECPSIDPSGNALYVLEISAGESDEFSIGDTVEINGLDSGN